MLRKHGDQQNRYRLKLRFFVEKYWTLIEMKYVYTRSCAVQLEYCINLLHPLRQAEEFIILFSGEIMRT